MSSPDPVPHPVRLVVGAAVVDDLERPTRLLSARRTEPSALAGGWELPGGKVDEGESPARRPCTASCSRSSGSACASAPTCPARRPGATWPLGDRYEMLVWLAEVVEGTPEPLEDHDELRWLGLDDLRAVGWLPADLPIVETLEAMLRRRPPPEPARTAS